MKRFRILAILILAILALGLLGACSKVMDTPTNLTIDLETEVLTWSSVEHASRYVVKITYLDSSNRVETKTSTSTQLDLSTLTAGNYEICVKVDGTAQYKESAWSEEIGYTKENAGGFTYTPINNSTEYQLTKAKRAKGDIVVPDTYKEKPVTVIGEYAFKGATGVTSVVVGNNVKKIGEGAFYNCNKMVSITLPDSINIIEEAAFQSCYSLTEITIPANITTISGFAFYACKSLTKVTFKGEVTEIGNNAFDSCYAITEFVIPETVTTIGDAAFANMTGMKTVTFGKNIEVMADMAFSGCRALESVVFPEGTKLVEIGEKAFYNCYYYYEHYEYVDGIKVLIDTTVSGIKSLELPSTVTTIGDQAFYGCMLLEEINIPSGVTAVGSGAFINTKAYTDSMHIRDYTEVEKENLIDFGENAEEIARSMISPAEDETTEAFESRVATLVGNIKEWYVDKTRDDMAYMIIADSLEEFRTKAAVRFKTNRTAEEELLYQQTQYWLVGASTFVVGYTTMLGTSATTTNEGYVVYSKGENKAKYTTNASGQLQGVVGTLTRVIKDGTIGIADNVFNGISYWSEGGHVSSLDMIRIPSSVKYIGDYAFVYNKSVTRLYATSVNSVETIGIGAFSYNKTLSNVQFASGVKTIAKYAFLGCERLGINTENPELLVPDTVEMIGKMAFSETLLYEGYSLGVVYAGRWIVGVGEYQQGAVELPTEKGKTIVGIAEYAFAQNASFTGFVGSGINSIKYVGRGAFYKCTTIASFMPDVKTSALTVYNDYLFFGCTSLAGVTFPRKLTSIGRDAFYKCESIREVDLSNAAIETIGKYAFYKCTRLGADGGVGLVLADPEDSVLTRIEDYAFYGCYSVDDETGALNGLKSIALPDTLEYLGEYAFANCALLSEIDFGTGISEILPYTFKSCHALETLTIPSTIKTIGDYAFIKCTGLEELVFNGGEEIGDFAFYGATNLKYITFGDAVKHIGRYAFKGATSLRSVAIPDTVEEIDANAFYACKKLTVYAEASQAPDGWHSRWNSSNRPVWFGCTLSDDNSYVVGVTLKADSRVNINSFTTVVDPERKGYVFAGWDKEIPATIPEEGVYLTARWEEGFTITYDLDGGTNDISNPYTYYTNGPTIVLGTPVCYTDEGVELVFDGWYDEDDNRVTTIPTGSSGDIKLTARWYEADDDYDDEGEENTDE